MKRITFPRLILETEQTIHPYKPDVLFWDIGKQYLTKFVLRGGVDSLKEIITCIAF